MENLPALDQASVSSPSNAKQLKNSKWLFIVLGVVILVLIGEGVYYFKLKKEGENVSPEQLPDQGFLSETVSYEVAYNIFDFPGWDRGRDAFFDSATGALVIINDISRHHTVANEAVSFSLQGDFEAQFAARAHSIDDPSQRQEAQILFYSGYPELPSSHGVEIRFIEENNLIAVNVINGVEKTAKFIVTPWDEVMAPESGALRVRFEDIVAGGNGRIIIYNDQGDELVARDLPFPVFAEQPRLYVKFAAVNATEDPQGVQMEVDYFRLLAPQGANNVVKR